MSAPILVLAPLREGEADAARAAIAALEEPFARVPGTHLARVQVLRPPPRRFRGRTRHYMLLAADHDGPVEPWLAAAARELAPALAHCAFWPGAEDPGGGRALGARARAAGRLLGRGLAARERRGGRRGAGAARARRGARGADDGQRRRAAAGGVEGVVIDVAELQGGIVRGYGQRFGFARHLFARVRAPRAARAFLAALADPVTTEEEWAQHPATTLNVALSFRALSALELPAWILDGFPEEVRDGMAARADRLGDDPATWEADLRELEVLIIVHAQSAAALQDEAGRWELELARGTAASSSRTRRRPGCWASSASTSASPTASRSPPSRASPARTSAVRGSRTGARRGGR